MRIIIDLGARFIKTVIIKDEENVVLASAVSLSEGIKNGSIVDHYRLSESIFASIRDAKDQLNLPLVNNEKDNIFITVSLNHCSVISTTKEVENNLILSQLNKDRQILHVWRNVYAIGGMEVNEPIAQFIKKTKHHNISIVIDKAAYELLHKICQQNNSSLVYLTFSNCTPIHNNNQLRIDVGYCSTRIFSKKNVHIIKMGLEELLRQIYNKCNIPSREAEYLLQLTPEYRRSSLSDEITNMCQDFVKNLFSNIINLNNISADDLWTIELQGGITQIPYIADFLEENFGITTKCIDTKIANNNHNFLNCECIINNIINNNRDTNSEIDTIQ